MNMIEKVARAIVNNLQCGDDWEQWTGVAKVAIKAMREPTEEMKEELNCLCNVYVVDWNKIIDAALKE